MYVRFFWTQKLQTRIAKLWLTLFLKGKGNAAYPECVREEEACVTTDSDWEAEDRACWAARLQLIMAPWLWGWCRCCSSGWGCCSWSWALTGCWFIQDGPLWESVCKEQQEQLGLFGTSICDDSSTCVFYDLRLWWQRCLPAWACWFTCLFYSTSCCDINTTTITPSLQATQLPNAILDISFHCLLWILPWKWSWRCAFS